MSKKITDYLKIKKKAELKAYTGSEVDKALQQSNPYALTAAIAEIHKAGGGDVFVMRKKTKSAGPSQEGKVDIADAYEDENFLETVKKKFGNGLYVLRLFTKQGEEGKFHSDHLFLLGEMPDPDAKKKKKRKKNKGKSRGSLSDRLAEKLILAAVEKDNNHNGFDMQSFLAMQQAGFDRAIQMQSESHKMMMTMMQGSGSSSLDEAVAILQLSREMQPQIEKDDPLTSIVTSLAPVVGQLLAARQAGANGDVAKYDGQLRQLLAKAAAAGVVAPGAAPAAMAGTESPQPQPPGATHVAPSDHIPEDTSAPVNPRTQEYFNERYIEPFRQDVADGLGESDLAYQIIAMSQYARDRMPSPPAIVEGFLTSGALSEYEAALKGFFAAIPELSSLPQKQEAIKAALIQMLWGLGPLPPTEPEEDINVIDGDTSIIQDTHSAEGTTVQDQTDDQGDSSEVVNEDVSG